MSEYDDSQFDLGAIDEALAQADRNPSGERFGRVRVMTPQQIAARTERMTRDQETGEPLIVIPDGSPLADAIKKNMMHGACRHFDLQQGQDECLRSQFWQRMMRDEGWRENWFENPGTYGFCALFDGRLMSAYHPATVRAEDLDSTLRGRKEADEPRVCPFYEDRRARGSTMTMGRYHKTNLEHV
jgi:hypothetical protein